MIVIKTADRSWIYVGHLTLWSALTADSISVPTKDLESWIPQIKQEALAQPRTSIGRLLRRLSTRLACRLYHSRAMNRFAWPYVLLLIEGHERRVVRKYPDLPWLEAVPTLPKGEEKGAMERWLWYRGMPLTPQELLPKE